MCCTIPDNLPESEDRKKLTQVRREIELYEKNRKDISNKFQELEVERKKINERLEKLWHEFRKLYRVVVVNKNDAK